MKKRALHCHLRRPIFQPVVLFNLLATGGQSRPLLRRSVLSLKYPVLLYLVLWHARLISPYKYIRVFGLSEVKFRDGREMIFRRENHFGIFKKLHS